MDVKLTMRDGEGEWLRFNENIETLRDFIGLMVTQTLATNNTQNFTELL